MKDSPRVAVCMPAYNAANTIRDAIDSILQQSYQDFQLVITDDCSTDNTVDVIKSYDDQRITLLRNEQNVGPAIIRNDMMRYCLSHSFEFMALMDSDDTVSTGRLNRQISILDDNPEIDACGGSMAMEKTGGIWHALVDFDEIKAETIFANPLPTPTSTIRLRSIDPDIHFWDDQMVPCDDYYFWYKFFFLGNLQATSTGRVEGTYKHSPEGVSHKHGIIRQEKKDAEVKQEILRNMSIDITDKQAFDFMKISLYRGSSADQVDALLDIGNKILQTANPELSQKALVNRLESRAAWCLEQNMPLGFWRKRRLYRSFLPTRNFYREQLRLLLLGFRNFLARVIKFFSSGL